MNEQLKNLIREVGDLREAIGVERARLQAAQNALAERERELTAKDGELQAALASATTAATPRVRQTSLPVTAPAPQPAPQTAGRPRALGSFPGMRPNSIPTKIVATLEKYPNDEFTFADLGEAVHKEPQLLYGTMARLVSAGKAVRVKDGVFKAAKRELKAVAES